MESTALSVREKVSRIINQMVTGEFLDEDHLRINDKLHIILSESVQALALVTTLEDEFDIEFEDEEIDVDFFLDAEIMIAAIERHLGVKQNL